VFAAVETARDIRQLARQIGRVEIKSASVAYATRDELTPPQKARAAEQAREAARGMEGAKARPGAAATPQPARSAIARPAAPSYQSPDGRAPEAAAKPIGAETTARPQTPPPVRTAPAGVLIPAFEGRGRDGVERDSLGRSVDGKSVAGAIASKNLHSTGHSTDRFVRGCSPCGAAVSASPDWPIGRFGDDSKL
jgi:hypothetical protein